jgi:hypothetical protein
MIGNPYILAAVAVAAFVGGFTTNGWRLNSKIDSMVAQHTLAVQSATEKAMQETARLQKEKDDAIAKAQVQIQANAAAAAAARRERDGLRDDLAASRVAIANASIGSLREHTSTLTTVFEQCAGQLEEMARIADGHATDTVMLLNAWPKGEQ